MTTAMMNRNCIIAFLGGCQHEQIGFDPSARTNVVTDRDVAFMLEDEILSYGTMTVIKYYAQQGATTAFWLFRPVGDGSYTAVEMNNDTADSTTGLQKVSQR